MEEDHKHVQMLPNGIKAASELLLAAKIFYQKLLDATTHPEDVVNMVLLQLGGHLKYYSLTFWTKSK